MKKYLLFVLLICGDFPGRGQGRDTAFAVRKLFREKRAAAGGLSAAGAATASDARYAQRPEGKPTDQEAWQDALAGAAFAGAGAFKGARYGVEEEAYVLRLYAAGQPIPPDIRRKLRRKHFHRTAKDIPLN